MSIKSAFGVFAGSLMLVGASWAAVVKGPYLIYEGNPTQMKVLWQLDANQTCTLRWGLTPSYELGTVSVTNSGLDNWYKQYKYSITGLSPSTMYYYMVDGIGSGSFRTAPAGNATDADFFIYGDPQNYPVVHSALCAEMIDRASAIPSFRSLAIIAGDWVGCADSEEDWTNQFFSTNYPTLHQFQTTIPYAGARGNADDSGSTFARYWSFPFVKSSSLYWSFDYGPIHFVVIDQYTSYAPGSDQYTWLVNDLSTTIKPWKIMIFHEPGWSAGALPNNTTVQSVLQPLCLQYDVKLVFAGHIHYYAHASVNGVEHVTTGGAGGSTGAELHVPTGGDYVVASESAHHYCEVQVRGNTCTVVARRMDGSVIEQFNIAMGPSVRITSPSAEARVPAGLPTTVSASVDPAGGTCLGVTFYADGQSIGTASGQPYGIAWTPTVPQDSVQISATALVDRGGSTESISSPPVTVTVYQDTGETLVESRISASSDDAEQAVSGTVYLNSSDIELVNDTYNDAGDQTVGLRFTSLAVPPGVTITQAYIQFAVDEITSGVCALAIRGQAADDASTFVASANNVTARPLTTAAVNWAPPDWTSVGAAEVPQRTPDLSPVIREIVNRPGWQLGNALAVVISGTGRRTAFAYDSSTAQAPQLVLKYIVQPPNQLPTAEAGTEQTVTDTDNNGAENVALDASGSADPDGTIASYAWKEGATVIASGTAPTVSLTVGVHTLTLEVTDNRGGTAADTVVITVNVPPNQPPVAEAGPNQTVTDSDNSGSEPVTLNGSGSSDPDGTIASYTWKEGSTTVATGATPTVTLTVGVHTLTLEITDNRGGTATDTVVITVNQPANQPPVAEAGSNQTVTDSDNSGTENVTLNGAGSSDPDGSIASFTWKEGATVIASVAAPTVSLTVGVHTLTLEITDNRGGTATDTVTITVSLPANLPPIAEAGPNQTVTDADNNGAENVTLNGSGSSDPDGTIGSYVWKEGATVLASVAAPTVTLTVGTHTLTLEVTDNRGGTAADTVTITVTLPPNQPPVAEAGPNQTVTDTDNNGAENVTLNGSGSSDPDGTIASYTWKEGSSTVATGATPTVTLTVGVHTLTLEITDNRGGTAADTVVITVSLPANQPPVAEAGSNQTVTDIDNNGTENVTLNGAGSSDPDGSIASYTWKEGSTTVATGATPTVSLTVGVHTLTLTVTDNRGGVGTDAVVITVNPDPGLISAPSNLTGSATARTVNLSWKDNSTNETIFVIERGVTIKGKTTWTQVGQIASPTPPNSTGTANWSQTVSASGTYSYRVRAMNTVTGRQSAYSNTASVRVR